MSISSKDRKILWSRSGGRCAFPSCKCLLALENNEHVSIVGEEAHIVGREQTDGSPRGAHPLPIEKRDSYDNLILLCPTHHSLIDKDPDKWKVEKLLKIKKAHESWVFKRLSASIQDQSITDEELGLTIDRMFQRGISTASKIELENIKKHLPVYVVTPQHEKGVNLLRDNSSLIISGDPGSGKTMLAHQLAFNFINLYEAQFIVLNLNDELKKFYEQFDENKPQVFLFDDFLGASILSPKIDYNFATKLISIFDFIKSTPQHYFILTTRNYILQEAKNQFNQKENQHIDYFDFPIVLEEYSRRVRFEILISHLRFYQISSKAISSFIVKSSRHSRIVDIVDHKNYFPRLIENAVISPFVRDAPDDFANNILDSLKHPKEIYQKSYDKLEKTSQALIVVLASFPATALLSHVHEAYIGFRKRSKETTHCSAKDEFIQALRILDGFIITTNRIEEVEIIGFKNPSIKEFAEENLLKSSSCEQLVAGDLFIEQVISLSPYIKINEKEFSNFIKNVEKVNSENQFCPRGIQNLCWQKCDPCPLKNYYHCNHYYSKIQFWADIFSKIPISSSSKICEELLNDTRQGFALMDNNNFLQYSFLLDPENFPNEDIDRETLFLRMMEELYNPDDLNSVITTCHYSEIFTNSLTKDILVERVKSLVDESAEYLNWECKNETDKQNVIQPFKQLKEDYLNLYGGNDSFMLNFLENCIIILQDIETRDDDPQDDQKDNNRPTSQNKFQDISEAEMIDTLKKLIVS